MRQKVIGLRQHMRDYGPHQHPDECRKKVPPNRITPQERILRCEISFAAMRAVREAAR